MIAKAGTHPGGQRGERGGETGALSGRYHVPQHQLVMIMDTTTITLSRSSSPQPEENAAMEGFKIVSAPHMTPYMVSIAPSFLLMASVAPHAFRSPVGCGDCRVKPWPLI